MFFINITVNSDVSESERNEKFPYHTEWLKKHFAVGSFLILGPCVNTQSHAGVILANVSSRDELQSILAEDCFYPDLATYDVKEFEPKFISENFIK